MKAINTYRSWLLYELNEEHVSNTVVIIRIIMSYIIILLTHRCVIVSHIYGALQWFQNKIMTMNRVAMKSVQENCYSIEFIPRV